MTTNTGPALRIGAFVLGALAIALLAVTLLAGGLFERSETVQMRFPGSVQGLQVGAPVVLRGVPVGYVTSIGLAGERGAIVIPVRASIRPAELGGATLPALLEAGLVARLATKSLLSGQLYVELDLRPGAAAKPTPAAATASAALAGAPLTIPTLGSWQQGVQEQVEALDLAALARELSATLTATRAAVGSAELHRTLAELARASTQIARASETLAQRLPGLMQQAEGTLAAASGAAGRLGPAAERVGAAAQQIESSARSADAWLTPGSPVHAGVLRATDELARSAIALRAASQQAEPTLQSGERALEELARAARAVRELAVLLEREPQSLLRGRSDAR